MKPFAAFFLMSMIVSGCGGGRVTLEATVTHIEPFPFATALGHQAMEYKQAAWIKGIGAGDSLAVLFGYDISGGDDISKRISLGRVYRFTISPERKIHTRSSYGSRPIDSAGNSILGLPIKALVDSQQTVTSGTFWIVVSVEEL